MNIPEKQTRKLGCKLQLIGEVSGIMSDVIKVLFFKVKSLINPSVKSANSLVCILVDGLPIFL